MLTLTLPALKVQTVQTVQTKSAAVRLPLAGMHFASRRAMP
jgi:hypothetical protein